MPAEPEESNANAITPFTLDIPQSDLDDLRSRLLRTRWPDPETVSDTSQGARSDKVRALVDHWIHRYDWRRIEAQLNEWGQYATVIDGLTIHVLHVRSRVEGARPLVLTHGWPGSVLEFRHVIGPFTDPEAHGGVAATPSTSSSPAFPGSVSRAARRGPGGIEGGPRARVGRPRPAPRLRELVRPGR